MKLGVNIDHVATIRQARGTAYPDVAAAARLAEAGGADFITAHLREDRRHIVDADLPLLRAAIGTHLNLEMAATDEMQAIALAAAPQKVCLVPERREELTTEGGLDACGQLSRLQNFCAPLTAAEIGVSLFIAPEAAQIDAAVAIGARAVELHTGAYAENGDLRPLMTAAQYAAECGLHVHAGHGLRVDNVAAVARLPQISELNIGHALIARALFIGLRAAVAEMKAAMMAARQNDAAAHAI